MSINDGDTIERNGRKYRVTIEPDDDNTPPWEREDGCGPVSGWTSRQKHPGERVLHRDRGSFRYYDFAAAVRLARVDGWDAVPLKTGTAGETANRAAEADFQRLRGWCNDDWRYVGVIVTPICPHCGEPQKHGGASLWGIESDAGDYFDEVVADLVAECEPATCSAQA